MLPNRIRVKIGPGQLGQLIEAELVPFLLDNDFSREEMLDMLAHLDAGETYHGHSDVVGRYTIEPEQEAPTNATL